MRRAHQQGCSANLYGCRCIATLLRVCRAAPRQYSGVGGRRKGGWCAHHSTNTQSSSSAQPARHTCRRSSAPGRASRGTSSDAVPAAWAVSKAARLEGDARVWPATARSCARDASAPGLRSPDEAGGCAVRSTTASSTAPAGARVGTFSTAYKSRGTRTAAALPNRRKAATVGDADPRRLPARRVADTVVRTQGTPVAKAVFRAGRAGGGGRLPARGRSLTGNARCVGARSTAVMVADASGEAGFIGVTWHPMPSLGLSHRVGYRNSSLL